VNANKMTSQPPKAPVTRPPATKTVSSNGQLSPTPLKTATAPVPQKSISQKVTSAPVKQTPIKDTSNNVPAKSSPPQVQLNPKPQTPAKVATKTPNKVSTEPQKKPISTPSPQITKSSTAPSKQTIPEQIIKEPESKNVSNAVRREQIENEETNNESLTASEPSPLITDSDSANSSQSETEISQESINETPAPEIHQPISRTTSQINNFPSKPRRNPPTLNEGRTGESFVQVVPTPSNDTPSSPPQNRRINNQVII
jgi:hypothetical protein